MAAPSDASAVCDFCAAAVSVRVADRINPAMNVRFIVVTSCPQTTEARLAASQLPVKFRSRIEPVTEAAHSDQVARVLRIGFDFLPQVVHVRIDDTVCNEHV